MRIQVNVNDDLVEELDAYAKSVGMSRSSLCAYFIGQGMYGIKKGIEISKQALLDSSNSSNTLS